MRGERFIQSLHESALSKGESHKEVADPINTTEELLGSVLPVQRKRILLGMRSTMWLSALAIPFSYGTTILLARIGPKAIGEYGVLSAYVAFVSSMLYFGGDAVSMKFLPQLDANKRLPFLLSYSGVICLCLIPWFVVAWFWPAALHYLFGHDTTASFQRLILYFSPLCILTLLLISALKGQLEIARAQAIARFQTVGRFLVWLTLYLASRSFVTQHSQF
jgi:hypothetical protein